MWVTRCQCTGEPCSELLVLVRAFRDVSAGEGNDIVDLSGEHAQALREALSRFIDAARRAPGTRSPARPRRKPSPGDPDSTEIRDWARSQGIDVKDRGRIPAELVVKFKAATTR